MKKSEMIEVLITAFRKGNKLLVCGNGGSATMADHLAAEFVGRFERERPPLPAISLTGNACLVTALGNDYSYEQVFSRQIEALGKPGDVLLILSTSGKSENCLQAIKSAETLGLIVLECLREGDSTAHIQEFQLRLLHDIVREVELAFL